MRPVVSAAAAMLLLLPATQTVEGQQEYLTWSAKHAEAIGKAAYAQGRVGGLFDMRLLKTERSYNYKLAATLLTPSVIRATARRIQLTQRMTDTETEALVAGAERESGIVVIVEIDPREGSGIIPTDWAAFLQPVTNGKPGRPIRGVNTPKLRDVQALGGLRRRNYDYDRFWVLFPANHEDGAPALRPVPDEVELVVRILDREGTVRWPMTLIR